MKKLTTIMVVMLCISITAFANDGKKATSVKEIKVGKNVSQAFSADFKNASNVSWSKTAEFYFAEFKLKEQAISAAYDEEGVLLGMARDITFSELPMAAQNSLVERFGNYNFNDKLTEIMYDGTTNYYLWAQGENKTLKLKCSPEGNVSVEKSIKKKVLPEVY